MDQIDFQEARLAELASHAVQSMNSVAGADDPALKAAALRVAAQVFQEATAAVTLRAGIANLLAGKR